MAKTKDSCNCVTVLVLMLFAVFVQPAVIPNDTHSTTTTTYSSSDPDITIHSLGLSELMTQAFGENDDELATPPTPIIFLTTDSTTDTTTVKRTEVPTTAQIGSSDAVTKPTTAALNPQELLIPPATVNASIAQMHNSSHRQLIKRCVFETITTYI